MKLLGERNWYLPSWLEWLPRIGDEGGPHGGTAPEGAPGPRGPGEAAARSRLEQVLPSARPA